jgi:hypothetical protein
MTNTITITDLTKVAAENNLPANNADTLRAAFLPFFEQASEWREKAFAIKVTNIGQTAEMGRARQARIALKDIRVQTEKTRVAMKEDSLRTGKAIDGMSNVIKFLIEPIEKYLLDQEEYGKRMQEIAQAEARDLRTCEAGKYLPDFPQSIDLGVISDEEFAKLLHFAKAQFDAREAAAAQIENERIEREQREAAEKEALRVENEKLRAEAAKVEAQRAKEREAVQKAEAEYNAKLAAERAESDRLRREAEAKELAENRRIEAEARAKQEAIEAPDKEKLLAYARILWELPKQQFSTEYGAEKFERAAKKILDAIHILQS